MKFCQDLPHYSDSLTEHFIALLKNKDKNFLEMIDQKKGARSIVESGAGKTRASRIRSKQRNSNLLNNSRLDAISKHISSYHSIGDNSEGSGSENDEDEQLQQEVD